MRIRTFTATTTQAAMAQVRADLGASAVIIAIDESANGRGVIVRAAADETAAAERATPLLQSVEERIEAFLAARLRPAGSPIRRAA